LAQINPLLKMYNISHHFIIKIYLLYNQINIILPIQNHQINSFFIMYILIFSLHSNKLFIFLHLLKIQAKLLNYYHLLNDLNKDNHLFYHQYELLDISNYHNNLLLYNYLFYKLIKNLA
jgi:hypothetical protein